MLHKKSKLLSRPSDKRVPKIRHNLACLWCDQNSLQHLLHITSNNCNITHNGRDLSSISIKNPKETLEIFILWLSFGHDFWCSWSLDWGQVERGIIFGLHVAPHHQIIVVTKLGESSKNAGELGIQLSGVINQRLLNFSIRTDKRMMIFDPF